MQTNEQSRLQNIIFELEKLYPDFKKMDIYAIVNNAYKKVHSFFKSMSDQELEEIRNMADQELRLSM
ncbi:MAG TPA: hypothetical protein VKT28_05460 [Puia sp.]|nr:hypothetical protein [Puia sp.]